ncbi:MAG: AAA family ATPase, partial [Candidatus Cloacimonetes bacterium]|nr:AAA family ATPase [Candidatus Cloacimonadota bacterium]MDD3562518.1 AAA family ATPase [Candidatus Cloacimonadota bacterium]
QKVQEQVQTSSRLTVITGRRRIGKTRLIQQFSTNYESLYFFISRKSEEILCEEFMGYIEETLKVKSYGKIDRLIDIFRLLFDLDRKRSLIIVIDEFQELLQINPAFLSDF